MLRKISNWGLYPTVEADVRDTDNPDAIHSLLRDTPNVIARGNGRCYGDSSLNEVIFSTLKLNRILYFDENQHTITCEAGVLLSDILRLIVPKGFFLPVTPGTKFITVGGAIAADVHGKNHHKDGCFSSHVLSFDLLTETGDVHTCRPVGENAERFWQTCGGMGLTGIILRATFRLRRIETSYIAQKSFKAANLAEVMQLFAEHEQATYSVAWIDCLRRGNSLGRSLLLLGEHAAPEQLPAPKQAGKLRLRDRQRLNIPFFLPKFTLNRYSIQAFNFLYFHKQLSKTRAQLVHYEPYFYPLDAIGHWNRLYGKSGFTQYQFVLPLENSAAGLRAILDAIAQAGQGSFLAVLKLFGDAHPNAVMSFPRRGYTLALDFKVSDTVFKLLNRLDDIVLDHGGRLYLAKDAHMSADFFKKTYPQTVPHRNFFQSMQSRRLIVG